MPRSHRDRLKTRTTNKTTPTASLIPLQPGIIYGPIRSRRLGRSLGLNLFPADRKICSFDCVYCHFGATTDHVCPGDMTRIAAIRDRVPEPREVLAAVEPYLVSAHEFDCITFSGNGEPTMYPYFSALVPRLRELIDRLRPSVKLALLSNSTTVNDQSLFAALDAIDLPIFKLDAGDQASFELLNRPCSGIQLESIITGLVRLAQSGRLVIQSVMIAGPVTNSEGAPFEHWLAAIRRICPGSIQLYTTDRPVADARVQKLTPEQLTAIAARVQQSTGIETRAF